MLLHSLIAALAAVGIGFIWYNPSVFGNAWMKSIGKTKEEMMEGGTNMGVMVGLTFFFSFLAALFLHPIVIHQFGLSSLLLGLDGSETGKVELMLNGSVVDYLHRYRTFKHGALHGTIAGIFLALPIIGMSAIYEKRGFKYIMISAGYWTVSLAVMGGIICGWE